MELLTYAIPAVGIVALLFAFMLSMKIKKQSPGNERMQEISSAIHEGAKAFLFAEYRILVFFILALFIAAYNKGFRQIVADIFNNSVFFRFGKIISSVF